MLGRALGFSDPEIIRIIQENYIPVVGDDWYQRRRKDEIGKFFRSVVDQTWKAGKWEPGGGDNRQGVYCFAPSGRMLTELKNVGSQPAELLRLLQAGVEGWKRLSPEERKPGAVQVGQVSFDADYHRPVPPGALVLRQYQRGLRREEGGSYSPHEFKFHDAPVWAQRDRVWVLQNEWKALIPSDPTPGAVIEIPASLRNRLIRYHFVEALVGEPGVWSPEQIRTARLTLRVDSATPASLRLHLEGSLLLSVDANAAASRCGLEGRVAGVLTYDRARGAFDRFDVVMIAECWGALNTHNAVSRPGRTPVGFSFELGTGEDADRVPPQGARELQPYLAP